jgi:hypothetical protein
MKMKIELGKKYERGDGVIVEVDEYAKAVNCYKAGSFWYSEDGNLYGRTGYTPLDLVRAEPLVTKDERDVLLVVDEVEQETPLDAVILELQAMADTQVEVNAIHVLALAQAINATLKQKGL